NECRAAIKAFIVGGIVTSERSDGNSGGTRHRPTDKRSGAACPQPLVHLPKIRPVNRCLRCHDRVALRFWGSRPGCDCEDRPNRKKSPEDKSEGFSSYVSLLIQEVRVDTN